MNFYIKTILLIVLGFAIGVLADGKKNEAKEITLPKIIIPGPKQETERKKGRATRQKDLPLIQKQKKQSELAFNLCLPEKTDFT